jgi:DNA-binding GntR family transcriptional regulator
VSEEPEQLGFSGIKEPADRPEGPVRRTLAGGRLAPTSLARQIADDIASAIRSGVYEPGDKVMSRQRLRKKWNTTHVTISRAYDMLKSAGLVYSLHGSGTFVAEPVEGVREESRAWEFVDFVASLEVSSRRNTITLTELIEMAKAARAGKPEDVEEAADGD